MGDVLKATGTNVSRYGLVIVLLWFGGMKFTAYEAEGIRPMVANSPLMSWAYGVMARSPAWLDSDETRVTRGIPRGS
jgi:uncharacterized membrane protein YkgB